MPATKLALISGAIAIVVLGALQAGAPYLGALVPPAPWQVIAAVEIVLLTLWMPLGQRRLHPVEVLALALAGLPAEVFTMAATSGAIEWPRLVAVRVLLLALGGAALVATAGAAATRARTIAVALLGAFAIIGFALLARLLDDGGASPQLVARCADLGMLAPLAAPALDSRLISSLAVIAGIAFTYWLLSVRTLSQQRHP